MSEPAFRVPMLQCDNNYGYMPVRYSGMTMRDYFAAHATESDLDSYIPQTVSDVLGIAEERGLDVSYSLFLQTLRAEARFAFADDMIRARGNETP